MSGHSLNLLPLRGSDVVVGEAERSWTRLRYLPTWTFLTAVGASKFPPSAVSVPCKQTSGK